MGTSFLLLLAFYFSLLGLLTLLGVVLFRFFKKKSPSLLLKTQKKIAPSFSEGKKKPEEEVILSQTKEKAGEKEQKKEEVQQEEATPSSQEIVRLLRRAEALIAQKEYDEAKKTLIRLLSWEENNLDAGSHLAFLYLQTGEHAKAEALFRRVLDIRPEDPSLLTNFSLALSEQGHAEKQKEALLALKKASEVDSKNANRYANLGQSYFFLGKIPEAIGAFQQAVHLDPRNIEFLFFLADSYIALESYTKAQEVFVRILEISPFHKEAQEELGKLKRREY